MAWVTVLGASGEQLLGVSAQHVAELESVSVSGGDAARKNLDGVVRGAREVKWTVGVKLEGYETDDGVVASATVFEVKTVLKRSAADALGGAGVSTGAARGADGQAVSPSAATASGGRGDLFGFGGAEDGGGFGFGGGPPGEAAGSGAAAASAA
eukprot:4841111-Pyramimonas_sp.AAC.1